MRYEPPAPKHPLRFARFPIASVVAAAVMVAAASTGSAATWTQQHEFTGRQGGQFQALSASRDGTTVLIGEPSENSSRGAAFVFKRNGTAWSLQQELTAADGVSGDTFGVSVSLSGDGNTALVGSANGAAYVFTRSGTAWTQQREFTRYNTAFGDSVSLSGDGATALVGAWAASNIRGAAYIFRRTGTVWSQQQVLANGIPYSSFGISVSLSGDDSTALVCSATGAYVFSRSGTIWSLQQELIPANGTCVGGLTSVSLSGNGATALVGASGANNRSGAVDVFTRNGTTWSLQQELNAPDGGQYFGFSVSLSSSAKVALIGEAGVSNPSGGAAYVFSRTGTSWSEQQELVPNDGASGDNFGAYVALSSYGSTALIADQKQNGNAGAAYVFTSGSS